MFSKNRVFLIIAGLFIVISTIAFYFYSVKDRQYLSSISENANLAEDNDELKKQVSQLEEKLAANKKEHEKELSSLKKQLSDKQKELESVPKLSQYFISLYKSQNLSEKQIKIAEDLIKRMDLVPQKAVLGGIMKIENIALLSPDYAYASYSDGHILGHMLLKYSVSKDGNIEWKLLHYSTY